MIIPVIKKQQRYLDYRNSMASTRFGRVRKCTFLDPEFVPTRNKEEILYFSEAFILVHYLYKDNRSITGRNYITSQPLTIQ